MLRFGGCLVSLEFTAACTQSCDCLQQCTDGPHTPRCGDDAWESGRNPNFSPSSSTSSIISCSSSGVGFCPSILITFPSSLVLMHPSSAPSTKMSKAALNSGERGERRCEGSCPAPPPCRQRVHPRHSLPCLCCAHGPQAHHRNAGGSKSLGHALQVWPKRFLGCYC